MQKWYHNNEETDAIMLQSRNGTQGEEGLGLKPFIVPTFRVLFSV